MVRMWFPNGPPLSYLPFPVPDPNKPWGGPCTQCKDECCGHFLKPQLALESTILAVIVPPSSQIKDAFDRLKGDAPSEMYFTEVASKVLLPTEEVKMWFDHLRTISVNCKRGALKAAETRKCTQAQQATNENALCFCGVCEAMYECETEEVEDWIACDRCSCWFHFQCVAVTPSNVPDEFVP